MREAELADSEAELERRETSVRLAEQARSGQVEGVSPAAPAVDDAEWWQKQLGSPLEAA
jgi:hypothetical protein